MTVIITGAGRGLGKVIGRRLVDSGQEVVGVTRETTHSEFPLEICDVTNYEDLARLAKSLKKAGRGISGLVNCAGVASMNLAILTPPEITQKIVQVNLVGTIFACQTFSPLLIRRGGGSIINFSTIAVPLGLEGESVYVGSKAGVEAFSRVLSRELAPFSIRVNCVAPGPIPTDLIRCVPQEKVQAIVRRQVLQEQFSPDDVAELVEGLLGEKFRSLSGQVLSVGGS